MSNYVLLFLIMWFSVSSIDGYMGLWYYSILAYGVHSGALKGMFKRFTQTTGVYQL